ncbi:MAG TPA: 16S rRNA (guanine(966)-N(2))-methyltransferase RsmD [Pyrinomonadaceae bacterium]|nr:16S rRNA (guanine(966)-N(2))-methyltransferase RsmD [Pyrinomonadaceae bacterium]
MRIIAGKYRGRNLKSPPSLQVRPTSDRLRETLFNVIAPRIEGARFLDLCAGSGAVGIEALSRGAVHSTFVDRSRKLCALIESNLDLVRIPEDETEVVQSEAAEFLRKSITRTGKATEFKSWNLVFFDPPYATEYDDVLKLFGGSGQKLLADEGLLIVEHHHKRVSAEEVGSLIRARVLKQGDSSLSFYEKTE